MLSLDGEIIIVRFEESSPVLCLDKLGIGGAQMILVSLTRYFLPSSSHEFEGL